jgi:hypothetical protein
MRPDGGELITGSCPYCCLDKSLLILRVFIVKLASYSLRCRLFLLFKQHRPVGSANELASRLVAMAVVPPPVKRKCPGNCAYETHGDRTYGLYCCYRCWQLHDRYIRNDKPSRGTTWHGGCCQKIDFVALPVVTTPRAAASHHAANASETGLEEIHIDVSRFPSAHRWHTEGKMWGSRAAGIVASFASRNLTRIPSYPLPGARPCVSSRRAPLPGTITDAFVPSASSSSESGIAEAPTHDAPLNFGRQAMGAGKGICAGPLQDGFGDDETIAAGSLSDLDRLLAAPLPPRATVRAASSSGEVIPAGRVDRGIKRPLPR